MHASHELPQAGKHTEWHEPWLVLLLVILIATLAWSWVSVGRTFSDARVAGAADSLLPSVPLRVGARVTTPAAQAGGAGLIDHSSIAWDQLPVEPDASPLSVAAYGN